MNKENILYVYIHNGILLGLQKEVIICDTSGEAAHSIVSKDKTTIKIFTGFHLHC